MNKLRKLIGLKDDTPALLVIYYALWFVCAGISIAALVVFVGTAIFGDLTIWITPPESWGLTTWLRLVAVCAWGYAFTGMYVAMISMGEDFK